MPPDVCPVCGAQLANGLCPRCLVKLAMDVEPPGLHQSTEADSEATQARDAGTDAPSSEATGEWTTAPTGQATNGDPADPNDSTHVAGDRDDHLLRGATVRYFGDYEIQKELGRGGMGVVYRARQVSLNRAVALKMIKAGVLADDAELQRFQNEAEAVALLDHVGIVPVYEVGDHEGQRYFSMKLVDGGNLADRLASFKDNLKAAATLMAETAEAVHHAHMRGILHRDLKPANILIDAEGHPHVTDFGLAKRVEGDVEFTQSGAILGTPAYMSPEQASGRRGAVTTASDVYGLGAILYALLAGKAPFGGDSVIETLDAVRTRPPEPPRKLNARVPRDLETICLKCLEKDPRRRYASAHELAVDLRNWLESRPIAARRVRPAERAWLWCKRRPAIAALGAATLLALVGGTAAVIAVQARANTRLRAANARVETRYGLAVDAIKTFHTGVSEDFLLKEEKFKDLRDRLLTSAADFYGKLSALLGKETDIASRRALAQSNFELAELTAKVGRKEDALAAHRAVLAAREALAADPGAGATAKVDVARSLVAIGRLLEATGRTDEALAAYRRAEAAVSAADGGPLAGSESRSALAEAVFWEGLLLKQTGRTADALRALEGSRELRAALAAAEPGDRDRQSALARSHHAIGILLSETGKSAGALAAYEAARAIRRKLAHDNPAVTDFRRDLAVSHHNLGILLSETGKPAEALAALEAARAILQKLADDNPAVTLFRSDLAYSHSGIGVLLIQTGKPAEALAAYEAARAIRRKLADDNPAVTLFRSDLAASHQDIGLLLSQTGKPAEALVAHEAARAIRRKLADDNPAVTLFRRDLAYSHHNIGYLLIQTGKPAEALAALEAARAIRRNLADDNPAITRFRSDLAYSHRDIGNLLWQMGRLTEAEAEFRAALAIQEKLAGDNPAVTEYQRGLASSLSRIGKIERSAGRTPEALHAFRRAVAVMDRLPTLSTGHRYDLACFQALLAGAAAEPGSGLTAAEARAEADRAMATLRRAVASGFRNLAHMRTDSDLDPLRGREDFQLLMLDLSFPANAFKK